MYTILVLCICGQLLSKGISYLRKHSGTKLSLTATVLQWASPSVTVNVGCHTATERLLFLLKRNTSRAGQSLSCESSGHSIRKNNSIKHPWGRWKTNNIPNGFQDIISIYRNTEKEINSVVKAWIRTRDRKFTLVFHPEIIITAKQDPIQDPTHLHKTSLH